MTNKSKIITAKFNGRCTKCGGWVPSGTRCEWTRGVGVSHTSCPQLQHNNSNGAADVSVTMGVFKKDGKIYVVKPNRAKTRVYAKEIVESPPRMTESGEVVDFETCYAPGVVYTLTENDRWDIADASDFLTKYSRCIVCGHSLKAAKSVAAAIGPVCAKYFAHKAVAPVEPISQMPEADEAAAYSEMQAEAANVVPSTDDPLKRLASLASASALAAA